MFRCARPAAVPPAHADSVRTSSVRTRVHESLRITLLSSGEQRRMNID
jgi:hypothetical protein